ncbi:MAG: PepSY-associated TM helix domain-containing protein [Lysobacter sp.]|nr:PepSY-associated TM helix domain-containing protein [Lysobacter sp.]
MNATLAAATPELGRRRTSTHRWIRQVHLWIGAWGALAAVLYGFTGLVMNHRFGDGAWPQGESAQSARVVLSVPADARQTPEALTHWLRETHRLDTQVVRKAKPDGVKLGGREVTQPAKWNLSGGSARTSWALEFVPGNATAEVKQSQNTTLAAFNRLHKGVGGGVAWILLADSFAIGMLLLGLSGLWMWARGRTAKQMVVSVLGLSVLVLAVVLVPALL